MVNIWNESKWSIDLKFPIHLNFLFNTDMMLGIKMNKFL